MPDKISATTATKNQKGVDILPSLKRRGGCQQGIPVVMEVKDCKIFLEAE
jgi:hypothetical protein